MAEQNERACDHTGDLLSVRDWVRYAVTRFETAGLVYGHGTLNAVDEAAFLVLAALKLPIDDASPWLDCRLTRAEREQLQELIDIRVTSRKPAAYLVHQAWIAGYKFFVDERVIVPRSFIGELLVRGQLAGLLPNPEHIESILELCTGSGCLAILAAHEFPGGTITASDISNDALAVARVNVKSHGLEQQITLVRSDLFASLPRARYDLIIANPPYVTQDAVEAFPPEYRAEPLLAHLGGADGLDLVHRILDRARDYLAENGTLVVEIGQARDALEASRPDLPFFWLDTEGSEGEVFMLSAADLKRTQKPRKARSKD